GADLSSATILRPTLFSDLDNDPKDAPSFHGANLTRIHIVATRLDGADFTNADMTEAVLGPIDHAWGEARYAQRSVMLGCDFSGSKLVRANLIN
ncbi:pentapeptide repeat-containing protein, partial [Escherichia coli]